MSRHMVDALGERDRLVGAAWVEGELAARRELEPEPLSGMAAHDGPVPVRTLAHAARLMREARQLSRYGISAGEPRLNDAGCLIASASSPAA